MKTPERYPAHMSVYATMQHLHADRARWKRKNRIAQLKRTITRLTNEVLDLHRIIFRLKNHQ